jgi:hypothetical protein
MLDVVSEDTVHTGLFLKATPKVTVQVLEALDPVVNLPIPFDPVLVAAVPQVLTLTTSRTVEVDTS